MTPGAFIIVDDDPLSCKICQMLIRLTFGADMPSHVFSDPNEAISFLRKPVSPAGENRPGMRILLLDINIPTCDGWEFLEKYGTLEDEVRSQTAVFVLTASMSPDDVSRAMSNAEVIAFIPKPITRQALYDAITKGRPRGLRKSL